MRRKKENSEFDLPGEEQYSAGEKQYSAREVVMYVVILVALVAALIVLGVMIWKVSRGIFGTDKKEPVEVAEQLEEENTGAESSEGQSESSESVSEDSQQTEMQDDQNPESTQTGSEQADAEATNSEQADTEAAGDEQANTDAAGDEQNADTSTASSMTFTDVSETVMAKSATNLRSEPSTESADTVVLVLESGIQVTRTGINADTGWSRLSCDGQVLYAVSSLLTTDLSGQTTGEVAADPDRVTTQDGRVIIFTSCDDTVTPKMSVNLRTEPSTSQGDATVYYELQYGETVRRTGYDQDAGWSRVEYNGQTLYAVTSYLYIVE